MLRLFQKTMFGEKRNITEHFADLNFTEKAVLLPLVVLVFLMGVYPNLFLKLTEPAVTQFIQTLTK
jgi:NADH-quinone oxidoreductase subunit M